jgi:hypothetical protein
MAIKNHIRDRRPKPMIAAAGYTGRTRTYSKGGKTKTKKKK